MRGVPELRPAVDADDALLFDVYSSTRVDELAQTGWDADQRRAFLTMQFEAQRADYVARFPGSELSIIAVDGADAGRLWVSRSDEEIRLLDIALLPQFRNRGVGTHLLRSLIEEAETSGTPLRHSVYTTNVDGLRFYRRLGFDVVEDFGQYVLMEWSTEPG